MIGKLDPEALSEVLSRTGAADDDVLVGPAYGEDAAAIRIGDHTLVASSDPISLAAERVGTLGVAVASNDVAASGADPRWLTNVAFLPDDDPELLDAITTQLDEAATELGVAIVGGHSEYAPELDRPKLSLTCLGLADEFVPTGGAEPGDALIVTKGAAIEGTAILASDFRDDLAGVPDDVLDRAEDFFDEISVVPESRIVRDAAHAMHDPTEGGLVDGLLEMAVASGAMLDVARESIPVREETAVVCDAMGVDPLSIFGSGALVAAVPEDAVEDVLAELDGAGIDAAVIGAVETVETEEDAGLRLDGEFRREPVRDGLYSLWEN